MKWIPGRVKDSDYYVNYDYEMWGKVIMVLYYNNNHFNYHYHHWYFFRPKENLHFANDFFPH